MDTFKEIYLILTRFKKFSKNIWINDSKNIEYFKECSENPRKLKIKYINSNRIYTPFKDEKIMVILASELKPIQYEKHVAYYGNFPLYNIKDIQCWNDYYIVFYNNDSEVGLYESTKFYLVKHALNSENQGIWNNWRIIASNLKNDKNFIDQEGTYLEKQYKETVFIHPKSILNLYLNKTPVFFSEEDKPYIPTPLLTPFDFNISQMNALTNAFFSKISIINGPPGTGKTQVILNLIVNMIAQNKTIGVVSSNNPAIENIKMKLEKNGYSFLVAHLGNNTNKETFFNLLPSIPSKIKEDSFDYEQCKAELKENTEKLLELMHINNERAKLVQEKLEYELEQKHFEIYFENHNFEKIIELSFYRQNPDAIIDFLVYTNLLHIERFKILGWIKLLFKFGYRATRFLKKYQVDLLLSLQRDFYIEKLKSLDSEIKNLEKQLEHYRFNALIEKNKKLSIQIFNHKLYKKYEKTGDHKFTIKNYKRNFEEFIERYPIILSTTHALKKSIPDNYLLDYLIIDEASQVDLITAGLALSACKNLVIVGDMKQLPQITDQTLANKLNLSFPNESYNYFKYNILSSIITLYGDAVPKQTLLEHYRCHPKIIGFCNAEYYNNKLIIFTKENINDKPLMLFKTSEGNHARRITRGVKKGTYNLRELDVTGQCIAEYLNEEEKQDLGFTTPFRKQANEAEEKFKFVECDTIHKYQGREKKAMLLSTVADDSQTGKMLANFVDDPCKINVAVSRAINKFILVTKADSKQEIGKNIKDLRGYIEYNTLDNSIIESDIVSIFDLLYQNYSNKLASINRHFLVCSKYKSENLMYTLLHQILSEEKYHDLGIASQVYLKNVINNTILLTPSEKAYVKHNASVDFEIYRKIDKRPVLFIEVDGTEFHENNPEQQKRDEIKNIIFNKYHLDLQRFKTNASGEEEKIRTKLEKVL